METSMEWDIDKIIEKAKHKSVAFLNACHACRPGHPLYGRDGNPFRNLAFMATGRVSSDAINWLDRQADEFDSKVGAT